MKQPQLQQELKKKQAFESSEVEAILNVLRTSDQFQNRLGKLFREYGLTCSQYNVLRILRGEGQPLPSLEIASRMVQVVPAITGLVDRLEEQTLVERKRCHKDRRVVYVAITPKGEQLLDEMDNRVSDLHTQLIGHLTRTELTDLNRLLVKARQSCCIDSEATV
jgi:DNA-binding MarR family transcriptional regulator